MHNPGLSITPTRFILLSIATMGLYPFYWSWRAWWVVGQAQNRQQLNVIRAFFLIFTSFSLFLRLRALATLAGRTHHRLHMPALYASVFGLTQVVTSILSDTRPVALLAAMLACSLALTITSVLPAVEDYNYYVDHTETLLDEPNKSWELFFLVVMVAVGLAGAYTTLTYQG